MALGDGGAVGEGCWAGWGAGCEYCVGDEGLLGRVSIEVRLKRKLKGKGEVVGENLQRLG